MLALGEQPVTKSVEEPRAQLALQIGEVRRRLELHLRLAALADEFLLQLDDLLDDRVTEVQSLEHTILGDLPGAALDHGDGLLAATHHEIESALLLLRHRREHDELVVDHADAHGRDRSEKRDIGDGQRRGRADTREHVRIVDLVDGHDERRHRRVHAVVLREQRADGAIDQPTGEDLLGRGSAFALDKAARKLAGGRRLLTVVDREGKEIYVGSRLGAGHRDEDHRVAVRHEDRPVSLCGDAARFDAQGSARDRLFYFRYHLILLRLLRV